MRIVFWQDSRINLVYLIVIQQSCACFPPSHTCRYIEKNDHDPNHKKLLQYSHSVCSAFCAFRAVSRKDTKGFAYRFVPLAVIKWH